MGWEYRVCKEYKVFNEMSNKELNYEEYVEYGIIEVYYGEKYEEGKLTDYGWADTRKSVLLYDSLGDLKLAYDLIRTAFMKPVLLIKGNKLIETDEIFDKGNCYTPYPFL